MDFDLLNEAVAELPGFAGDSQEFEEAAEQDLEEAAAQELADFEAEPPEVLRRIECCILAFLECLKQRKLPVIAVVSPVATQPVLCVVQLSICCCSCRL